MNPLSVIFSALCWTPILLSQTLIDARFSKVEILNPENDDWYGKPLVFNYHAQRILKKEDLQIRVFRGSCKRIMNEALKHFDGRCYNLFSTVYRPSRINGAIEFGETITKRWLNPMLDGSFTDEKYLVIFEEGQNPDGAVRIGKDYLCHYLARGFPMSVLSPPEFHSPDTTHRDEVRASVREVQAMLVSRRQELVSQELLNGPCLKTTDSRSVARAIVLQDCNCQPLAGSGLRARRARPTRAQ